MASLELRNEKAVRLEQALIRRHVGPARAEELVRLHPSHTIQSMLDLFDWYNQRGQQRHAGFLVMAIRSPASITMPRGFESSVATATKRVKQAHKHSYCFVKTKHWDVTGRLAPFCSDM